MIKVRCKDCRAIVEADVQGVYPRHVYVRANHHHRDLDTEHSPPEACSLVGWGAQWEDILSPHEQVEAEAFMYALTRGIPRPFYEGYI